MTETAHYEKLRIVLHYIVKKNVANIFAPAPCDLKMRIDLPSGKIAANILSQVNRVNRFIVINCQDNDFAGSNYQR
jgi:hypothetical protein